MAGRVVDLAELLRLAGAGPFALHDAGHAEHCIEGGADLVAHVGQEGALGAAGAFGGILGQGQFAGPGLHQALELEAVTGQLCLVALLFGDVLLDAEVMGDAAIGPAHRGDDRRLHVDFPGLAPIDQLAPPHLALAQAVPQLAEDLGRGLAGVHDPRVLAAHFVEGVAGGLLEGLVDVEDARLQIGQHDAARALLHRGGQHAQLLLGPLAFGDVGEQAGELPGAGRVVVVLVVTPGGRHVAFQAGVLPRHRGLDVGVEPEVLQARKEGTHGLADDLLAAQAHDARVGWIDVHEGPIHRLARRIIDQLG